MRGRAWTVEDELKFISGIGSFYDWNPFVKRGGMRPSKHDLLRKYLLGLSKRHHGFTLEEMAQLRSRANLLLSEDDNG